MKTLIEEFDKRWPLVETEIGDDHPHLSLREIRDYLIYSLQKARHDWLREEIVKLKAAKYHEPRGYRGKAFNEVMQTIIDRYQAELDQDNK